MRRGGPNFHLCWLIKLCGYCTSVHVTARIRLGAEKPSRLRGGMGLDSDTTDDIVQTGPATIDVQQCWPGLSFGDAGS